LFHEVIFIKLVETSDFKNLRDLHIFMKKSKGCIKKYKPKKRKKVFSEDLEEKAEEEENEKMIEDESERENLDEEKEIDEIDIGDGNEHLEDELQGEEEED